MDMSKIDKDIKTLLSEGKTPILLLGEDVFRELAHARKLVRKAGVRAMYNGVQVILNACNPDKCEVVVKE